MWAKAPMCRAGKAMKPCQRPFLHHVTRTWEVSVGAWNPQQGERVCIYIITSLSSRHKANLVPGDKAADASVESGG